MLDVAFPGTKFGRVGCSLRRVSKLLTLRNVTNVSFSFFNFCSFDLYGRDIWTGFKVNFKKRTNVSLLIFVGFGLS